MSGVNYICVKDKIEETAGGAGQKYILLPFYRDGKPLTSGKKWGMTLLKAGLSSSHSEPELLKSPRSGL